MNADAVTDLDRDWASPRTALVGAGPAAPRPLGHPVIPSWYTEASAVIDLDGHPAPWFPNASPPR